MFAVNATRRPPWERFLAASPCASLRAVPNRWTCVPDGVPPPPPRWGVAALPIADLFMRAMLSRPPGGSLRATWVTPATVGLCLATAVGAIAVAVLGAVGLARGGGWPSAAGMVVCAAIAAGSAAVAVVGIAQRRPG